MNVKMKKELFKIIAGIKKYTEEDPHYRNVWCIAFVNNLMYGIFFYIFVL